VDGVDELAVFGGDGGGEEGEGGEGVVLGERVVFAAGVGAGDGGEERVGGEGVGLREWEGRRGGGLGGEV